MYDMTLLVQKFRDGRKRLGINQTEFARRLGVSLATITRWERANMVYTPDIHQLSLIADMVGTTVWELLTPDATKTVTFDESPAGTEALAPEVEPAAQETSPIVSNDETPEEHSETQILTGDELPEEQPATPVVIPDDSTETVEPVTIDELSGQDNSDAPAVTIDELPQTSAGTPEMTSQEQAPNTGIPDEIPQDLDIPLELTAPEVPELVNTDEIPDITSDTQDEPAPVPEAQNIVTSDGEQIKPEIPESVNEKIMPAENSASGLITYDEPLKISQSVIPDEGSAPEAAPIITNEELPQDTDILGAPDETVPEPAEAEVQEPVTTDEATEQPADASEIVSADETPEAPEAAPQDQAPDTVINDDVKPDNKSLTEVSPVQMELPETVTPDESLTENTTAPDLFEIVHHDESSAETENFITESEPAAPEIPPIISSDEIPEDPSDTLIVGDDDAPGEQPDMPVVTSDDIPEPASSVTNDDAIPAEIPTEEPVIHDEAQEPQETVNVDEGHAPDATLITNEELPQDTDILSAPDETVPEPVTAEAQELVTTDETAEPATNTPKLVKSDEIPEAAPQAQSAQDAKAKPWEELGISRAWYYRLKQHGRLEEYLKERAEQ